MQVRYIPTQPLSLLSGGFEIQMLSAAEAAARYGINIAPLNHADPNDDYDIMHFWGCDYFHRNNIELGFARGKKIVVSALFPYKSWYTQMRYMASLISGTANTRRPMLHRINAITVVNAAQKSYATDVLNVPDDIVHIIPNIIEGQFLSNPINTPPPTDLKNYVLTCGTVCKRKNQTLLVRACKTLNLPLLVVGPPSAYEPDYIREFQEAIAGNSQIHWIPGLPYGSNELLACYQNCACFALISLNETQPIAALEAIALEKPLLLSDRPYAHTWPFAHIAKANPDSVSDVINALNRIVCQQQKENTSAVDMTLFSSEEVGKLYANVYKKLV